MAKRHIKAGSTAQTIDVFIQDSSSVVGAGLVGLVFNTGSLVCYFRKGATGTPTALTLVTQTVGGAHTPGGFCAVDAVNCPGLYRLDLSDTMVAASGMVTLYLRGATNMAPVLVEIEVVLYDPFDGVRMGLTALPAVAAEAAGGLYTRGSGPGQINQPANGVIDANTKTWNGVTAVSLPPTAQEIFASVVGTVLTESYAADGAAPTLAQLLFLVQQSLHEFSISGFIRTVKKLDGSATAAEFTFDSTTQPTSSARTL